MGYPMKKDIKIKLIFLFYEILCECAAFSKANADDQLCRDFLRPS